MKVLATFTLIGMLAAFSPAQTPASRSTASDLQIVSYRFEPGNRRPNPFSQVTQTDRDGRILSVSTNLDGPIDGYKATLVVKNTGAKTVKAINWSIIQFDRDSQKEVKRLGFRNKKQLSPGEMEKLTAWAPPVTYAGTVELRAAIDRIEYSDGSSWTR